MMFSAVSTEYRRVTDGRTDGQTDTCDSIVCTNIRPASRERTEGNLLSLACKVFTETQLTTVYLRRNEQTHPRTFSTEF